MATERERKFLVDDDGWQRTASPPVHIHQGYFDVRGDTTVRVRTFAPADDSQAEARAELTIKGPPDGWRRLEFEYDIPLEDASEMLDAFCEDRIVRKRRYTVHHGAAEWTVDAFDDGLTGLVLAEIELHDDQPFDDLAEVDLPDWLDREVSEDRRFTNAFLARHGLTSAT